MKQNKQILKSIEQLLKNTAKTSPNKPLSGKQIEALAKGREVLAKSKNKPLSTKIRKVIDFTNLTTGLLSILKLFKTEIIKTVAFLALIYYRIRTYEIFDYFKIFSYAYLIIGIFMFAALN